MLPFHPCCQTITADPAAVALKEGLNEAEAALAGARNKMKLGYTDPKTGVSEEGGGVEWMRARVGGKRRLDRRD